MAQDNPLKATNYSLCIPTSIISRSNAKNLQQTTSVLYQIARVATIFKVSEIIVMDTLGSIKEPAVDLEKNSKKIKFDKDDDAENSKEKTAKVSEDAMLIATILQYFVTPPYLIKSTFRKEFFKNLQYAKDFPKLSTLPFMNPGIDSKYREGLTVQMGKVSKPLRKSKKHQPLKSTKYVNIGYDKYLELQGQQVPTNVRVTVDTETKKVVSPAEAYRLHVGAKSSYGFHVRIANTFTSIFTESSYKEGYTQSLWVNSADYFHHSDISLKEYKHDLSVQNNLLLIVCKWQDLEYAFKKDSKNLEGVESAKEFLDGEIRIPSGTRIEDGAMIALAKISI